MNPLIWLLFFLSGFSALIYEVLWTRQLTVIFGNTVHAAASVLAAFMGGLALGAWTLGRRASRWAHPLHVYAILEASIGLFALGFPLILALADPLYGHLYRSAPGWILTLARFSLTFAYLLLPTLCMGATLPVLSLAVVQDRARVAAPLAGLYSANTLGAVLGVLSSGLWMLPSLGLDRTLAVAVCLNFAIAMGAWLARGPRVGAEALPPAADVAAGASYDRGRSTLVLAAYGLSGFFALGLEVLWTRVLLLVFGSTVYSFSIMLATFLLGLAVGAALMGIVADRIRRPLTALGFLMGAAALCSAWAAGRVNELPISLLGHLVAHGFDWNGVLWGKVLLAAGTLLPLALFFGAVFPVVARVRVRSSGRTASEVGSLWAWNTTGAIAGSIGAGFALLPALGMERALLSVSVAMSLVALLLLLAEPATWGRRLALAAPTGLVLAAAFVGREPWDPKLLTSGVYFQPRQYVAEDRKTILLEQRLSGTRLLAFEEGLTATAAVVERSGDRSFLMDGKVEASTTLADMRLQRMQGHLPMLFALDPKRVVNIGLGCGVTLGALGRWPVESLTSVEIEPKTRLTARFFAAENHGILDHPLLRFVFNDGRNHIRYTADRYDVITSDPFEPLVGGAASLYTYEHFLSGRARLAPGGIFAQYLPMYQLAHQDFRTIVRSFTKAFPHVSLWYTGIDTIMLGSEEPHTLSEPELLRRLRRPSVADSLREAGFEDPVWLLRTFVTDPHTVPYPGDGPLNTDGHPVIEFNAPKSHLAATTIGNLEDLIGVYRPEEIPVRFEPGGELEARYRMHARRQRQQMQAFVLRGRGDFAEAVALLERAFEGDEDNPMVRTDLAQTLVGWAGRAVAAGNRSRAEQLLRRAVAVDESRVETLEALCRLAMSAGRWEEALRWCRRYEDLRPSVPENRLRLDRIHRQLGQRAPGPARGRPAVPEPRRSGSPEPEAGDG